MKIRELLVLGLGAIVLLSGCVHGHEYVMYTGEQQSWPTQKGAFVVTKYAVPIYWRSYPDRPYNVMAVLDGTTARICVDASADMAKDMHTDAIILLTEGSAGGGVSVGTGMMPSPTMMMGTGAVIPTGIQLARFFAIKWK
jgi:hypothetical protein